MAEQRDQDDVLPKKDNVTSSDRGLQIWDDDELVGEGVGTGGSGTAERAAKIARGQKRGSRP
ncbi:MAG TPA: hypothetical protein VM582_07790 [Candidatus Thermoplasmatota archaeon]|nr:hypothetical protein [Candidatus Thermoplasmatota archaeon]